MATTEASEDTPPPWGRRRLAIGLLGLLIAALGPGLYLGTRISRASAQRRAVATIRAAGGYVFYDWEHPRLDAGATGYPPGPGLLGGWLGPEYFQEIAGVHFARTRGPGGREAPLRPLDLATTRELARLGHLKTLSLPGIAATTADLERLGRLTTLEGLELAGPGVNDAGIAEVARLKRLKHLRLARTRIGDAGLECLVALRSLEWLVITGRPDLGGPPDAPGAITDRGLAALGRLTGLRRLEIDQGAGPGGSSSRPVPLAITDAGLESLGNLQRLEVLTIQGAALTDAGIEALRALKRLRTLTLVGGAFTDAAFGPLSALPQLRTLSLDRVQASDRALDVLAEMPALISLAMPADGLTAEGLVRLRASRPELRFEVGRDLQDQVQRLHKAQAAANR